MTHPLECTEALWRSERLAPRRRPGQEAKAMDGSTEHEAPRGAAQSGSEQECGSMPAKAMAPRTSFKDAILDGPFIWRPRQAPEFDTQGKGVQFFAKDSDGQWHYVNHAGTWQACPPPIGGADDAAP